MKLIKLLFDSRFWCVIFQQYGAGMFKPETHVELSPFIARNEYTNYVIRHFCLLYKNFIVDCLNEVYSLLEFDEDLYRRIPFEFRHDFNYLIHRTTDETFSEETRVACLNEAMIELLETGEGFLNFFSDKAQNRFAALRIKIENDRKKMYNDHLKIVIINTGKATQQNYFQRVANAIKYIWRSHDQHHNVV